MRDVFPEYYLPDDAQEAEFITEAVVVVDTNVLLDLYRMTAHERDQLLEALSKVGDRLWIPFQVGREYQHGRMGAIKERAGKYKTLGEAAKVATADSMRAEVRGLNLPDDVTAAMEELLDPLADQLAELVQPFADQARSLAAEHVIDPVNAWTSDPVRDRLDELFAGRVGSKPDDETHTKRVDEASERADRKQPPGYRDAKKGDANSAGDYLLWAELLQYAASKREEKKRFLFVTRDQKEDWYILEDKVPVGPRRELVVEFAEASPHGYHQMTTGQFLTLARQHLGADVDSGTIARADSLAAEAATRVEIGWPSALAHDHAATAAWHTVIADAVADMGYPPQEWWRDSTLIDPAVGSGAAMDYIRRYRDSAQINDTELFAVLGDAEARTVQRLLATVANIQGAYDHIWEAVATTARREAVSGRVQVPIEGHPEVSPVFVEALAAAATLWPRDRAGDLVRVHVALTHPQLTDEEQRLLTGLTLLRAGTRASRRRTHRDERVKSSDRRTPQQPATDPAASSDQAEPRSSPEPEPDVSEPDVPEPDAPEPDAPEPDVPESGSGRGDLDGDELGESSR